MARRQPIKVTQFFAACFTNVLDLKIKTSTSKILIANGQIFWPQFCNFSQLLKYWKNKRIFKNIFLGFWLTRKLSNDPLQSGQNFLCNFIFQRKIGVRQIVAFFQENSPLLIPKKCVWPSLRSFNFDRNGVSKLCLRSIKL